jgi:hypothetical protein
MLFDLSKLFIQLLLPRQTSSMGLYPIRRLCPINGLALPH